MVWWQLCIIELCKGISWALPIFALFLGAAWFISFMTIDVTEKVKEALPQRDK